MHTGSGDGRGRRARASWIVAWLCLLGALVLPLVAFATPQTDRYAAEALGAAGYLQLLLLGWLLAWHRRPSVWPKIACYGGWLLALGLLARAVVGMAVDLEWLRYLVTVPVPPLLAYLFARVAVASATAAARPESRMELGWPAGNRWVLLQYDRIALAPTAGWLPGPGGIERALLWRDVEYLQFGQVTDPDPLVTPMLRVVGDGREFVLPLRRGRAREVFEFAVARAEIACADHALSERDAADAAAARRLVRAGVGLRHPTLALVSAVAGLSAALCGWVFGTTVAQLAAGGCACLAGLLAVLSFAGVRRENRLALNHPGGSGTSPEPDSAHPDSAHPDNAHPDSAHPDSAPMPGWNPLTPPVYPKAVQSARR